MGDGNGFAAPEQSAFKTQTLPLSLVPKGKGTNTVFWPSCTSIMCSGKYYANRSQAWASCCLHTLLTCRLLAASDVWIHIYGSFIDM